jgi:MFS family permease
MFKNNRVPLFYIVTSFFWFALYTYVPHVSPYGETLGADIRFIGLIVGAYGFMQMLVRFPLGVISDRLGRRKVFVLGGIAFAAVSGFVVFLFPNPNVLFLSRALGGVAASSWVTFSVLNASYYKADETVKSVGYINAANSLGTVVALLVGGWIAQRWGVPYAFLVGGLGGFAALVMGFGIKEKRAVVTDPPSWVSLLNIVRNKQLLFASLLGVFVQFVRFASQFGFTPLVAVSLGANPFQIGLLGVFSVLPGLFISPLVGTVLFKRFGTKKLLIFGFALAGLSCMLIPFSVNLWQLFVIQIIGSMGMSAVFTLLMGLCINDIPTGRRATAMGFFQAVYGLGMFLGPFLMGWMGHSFGLTTAFVISGILGLVGVLVVSVKNIDNNPL